MDISVVLPVINEGENLRALIPRLRAIFDRLRLSHEILVVDGGSTDGTREIAAELGARVLTEQRKGYAGALTTGFADCHGDFVLTLDADLSHDPGFVRRMWRVREQADITIASRYVRGGTAYSGFTRKKLSEILNSIIRRILALPALDVSSGYRLYRAEVLRSLKLESRTIEVLEEILAKACSLGFVLQEVPFTYFPRGEGRSHAKILSFGIALIRSSLSLRAVRNSPDAADYEERTFYTLSVLRRLRERRRHRLTLAWARGSGRGIHILCGSSVAVRSLNNTVGLDSRLPKLRFLRPHSIPLVAGGLESLPFKDSVFDCAVCYLPVGARFPAAEMARILRPDGKLVVSAPGAGRPISGAGKTELLPEIRVSARTTLTREQQGAVGGGETIALYRKKIAGGNDAGRSDKIIELRRRTAA